MRTYYKHWDARINAVNDTKLYRVMHRHMYIHIPPLSPCNINSMYIEPYVSVDLLGVDSVPQVVS